MSSLIIYLYSMRHQPIAYVIILSSDYTWYPFKYLKNKSFHMMRFLLFGTLLFFLWICSSSPPGSKLILTMRSNHWAEKAILSGWQILDNSKRFWRLAYHPFESFDLIRSCQTMTRVFRLIFGCVPTCTVLGETTHNVAYTIFSFLIPYTKCVVTVPYSEILEVFSIY